jgi:hypothetical protein
MKDNGRIMKQMAQEYFIIVMDQFMRVNGKIIYNMDMERLFIKIILFL